MRAWMSPFIARIKPLPGAKAFLDKLRQTHQVVILSDTFEEFAKPLMKQLGIRTEGAAASST